MADTMVQGERWMQRFRHRLLIPLATAWVALLATGGPALDEGLAGGPGVVIAVAWSALAATRVLMTTGGFDFRYPVDPWSIVAFRWLAVIVAENVLVGSLRSALAARADTTAPSYRGLVVAFVLAAACTIAAAAYRRWAAGATAPPRFAHPHLLVALALGVLSAVPLVLLAFLAAFSTTVAALGVLVLGGAIWTALLVAAIVLDRRWGLHGIAAASGRMVLLAVGGLALFFMLTAFLDAALASS